MCAKMATRAHAAMAARALAGQCVGIVGRTGAGKTGQDRPYAVACPSGGAANDRRADLSA